MCHEGRDKCSRPRLPEGSRRGALRARQAHRCCTGPITLLKATTKTPEDASSFVAVSTGDVDIRVHGAQPGLHELEVGLRGVVRKHPVAFWNGCAYQILIRPSRPQRGGHSSLDVQARGREDRHWAVGSGNEQLDLGAAEHDSFGTAVHHPHDDVPVGTT